MADPLIEEYVALIKRLQEVESALIREQARSNRLQSVIVTLTQPPASWAIRDFCTSELKSINENFPRIEVKF